MVTLRTCGGIIIKGNFSITLRARLTETPARGGRNTLLVTAVPAVALVNAELPARRNPRVPPAA